MSNIILYSGGYDSTLIIHELLNRYPDNEFIILGFNINLFNPEKNRAENYYRDKYIDYLYNDAKTRNFKYVKIDSEVLNNAYDGMKIYMDGGIAQQQYFVFMTSYFSPSKINNIFTGFHNGDCYFKYEYYLNNIYEAVGKIMNKEIKFHHLLRNSDKYQIINKIRENGLEEFCFTCENPLGYYEECGVCKPCTELKISDKRISHSKRKNIEVYSYIDYDLIDSILEVEEPVKKEEVIKNGRKKRK